MHIAIVPNDNVVVIDGRGVRVELQTLRDQGIHAVQYEAGSGAEVEYVKPANRQITEEAFNTAYSAIVTEAQALIAAEDEANG